MPGHLGRAAEAALQNSSAPFNFSAYPDCSFHSRSNGVCAEIGGGGGGGQMGSRVDLPSSSIPGLCGVVFVSLPVQLQAHSSNTPPVRGSLLILLS